jgi:hypothetical protein
MMRQKPEALEVAWVAFSPGGFVLAFRTPSALDQTGYAGRSVQNMRV